MVNLGDGEYLGINQRKFAAGGIILTGTEYHAKVFEGWHSHQNNHLSLVVRGGNLEERGQQTLEVLPGKLLFYHQGELHRNLHTCHPSKNINLEISPLFLKKFDLTEEALHKIALLPQTIFSLLKMYREAGHNDQFSADSIHMLLLELADLHEKLPSKQPAWLTRVTDHLHDNWRRHPGLTEIAAVAGVNRITVSKHFSKYLGCTLGEFMRREKVRHALRLIHAEHMSLTELGFYCGFSDQSHFIRTFYAQTGFLPRDYRRL